MYHLQLDASCCVAAVPEIYAVVHFDKLHKSGRELTRLCVNLNPGSTKVHGTVPFSL